MTTKLDNRQSRQRTVLDSLSNDVNLKLDTILNLINDNLQPSLRISETVPASRTINIGPICVQTLDGSDGNGRYHVNGLTSTSDSTFTGATVTFPSATGGNITTSAGSFVLGLNCPVGEYVKVLIYFKDGDIRFAQGSSSVNKDLASIPSVPSTINTGGIYVPGYVLIHNTGGTIDVVTGENIYQFSGDILRLQDATIAITGLVNIGTQTFGGNKTFNNDLSVNGNTTLGNASSDTLTINGITVSIPNGLNFDSNTFVIDSANNRIGINIASPTEALDISGNAKISGDLAVNGGDITTTATTFNLINTTATTLNFGGAATSIILGATTGTMTLRNPTIIGSQSTQNLFNTVATTLNFGGAATTLNIGGAAAASTTNVATGVLTTGTKTVNIGTGATAGTTNINIGATAGSSTININGNTIISGDTAVNGGDLTTTAATATLFNTNATTLNIGNAATTLNMGNASGTNTINGKLVLPQYELIMASDSVSRNYYLPSYTTNYNPKFQIAGTGYSSGDWISVGAWNTSITASGGGFLSFNKSNGAAIGTHAIIVNDQRLGAIGWAGSDGVKFTGICDIYAEVESNAIGGTPSVSNMPGRIIFATTSPTGVSPTEKVRIDSNGLMTLVNNLVINGGNITTAATTTTLFNTNTTGFSLSIACGTTSTGNTKTVNIGLNGASGSTTNINFGSSVSGSITNYVFNSDKAILAPIGDTASRPTGINGMFRYNTSNSVFEHYTGGSWKSIASENFATAEGIKYAIVFG